MQTCKKTSDNVRVSDKALDLRSFWNKVVCWIFSINRARKNISTQLTTHKVKLLVNFWLYSRAQRHGLTSIYLADMNMGLLSVLR